MVIGEGNSFGEGCEVIVMNGYLDQKLLPALHSRNHVQITARCRITCASKIQIDDDVLIAPDIFITDHNHGMNSDHRGGYSMQPLLVKGIHICEGVWLGQHACELPGVTNGAHSIIGANSMVTHDIPAYSIAVGAPARVVKTWDRERRMGTVCIKMKQVDRLLWMKLKTAYKLLIRFCKDCEEFSFGVAKGRLVRDLPFFSWDRRKKYYDKTILKYLNTRYGEILGQTIDEQTNNEAEASSTYVWVMWWQGVNSMPDIVRACWEQLNKVIEEPYQVVLITKENYNKYIELAPCVIEKCRKGFVSATHLSDIIRVSLLRQYGGFWIDATMYVNRIPEEIIHEWFYTLHAPGLFPNFIGGGNWSTFFLYAQKKNEMLFVLLEQFFALYWNNHSKAIDYLFFDYAIELILQKHPDLRIMIDNIVENRNYYALNVSINEPYDKEAARYIIEQSPLQKLTYKKDFLAIDKAGHATNYQRLITGSFLP